MIKKLLSLMTILCLIFSFTSFPVSAESSGVCESGIKWNVSADNVLTLSGKGEMYNNDFPWEAEYADKITKVIIGEGITSIDYTTFQGYYYTNLTEVVLPSTLKIINDDSFNDLKLTSITLPEGIEYIGESAFCGSLITSIDIPESVTYLGEYAFGDCENLSTITGGEGLKEVGASVFYGTAYYENEANWENNYLYFGTVLLDSLGAESLNFKKGTTIIAGGSLSYNSNLVDITIPSSVIYIGNNVFSGRTINKLTLNEGLEKIGERAFERANIKSVVFPDSLREIGDRAFWECTSLESVTFGKGLKIIGENAFQKTKITSVVLPEGMKTIKRRAFADNENIVNIDLGGVINIEGYAFSGASKLESVIIPDTVELLEHSSFENCTSLKSVVIGENVSSSDAFVGCSSVETLTIKGEYGYELYNFPNLKTLVIGDKLTEENIHSIPKSVESITFGKGFKNISNNLTRELVNLSSISISDETIHIDVSAFTESAFYKDKSNWENGTLYIDNHLIKAENTGASFRVKEGTVTISDQALSYNYELESVYLPSSLRSIGSLAFYCDNNLKEITVPESVTHIYQGAFDSCYNLEEITLPDSLRVIEGNILTSTPFYNNTENWENGILYCGNHILYFDESKSNSDVITIKDGTISIAEGTFSYKNIKEVKMPNSVRYINDRAFDGCTSLTKVNLSKNLNYIGDSAFYRTGITEIVIPTSVDFLGYDAFGYCKSLTKAQIGAKIIDENCFSSCDLLSDITLFEGVESIGDHAFSRTPITKIVLPNSLTTLGYSFSNCTHLDEISIGTGITYFDGNFNYCGTVSVLKIPKTLIYAVDYAFYDTDFTDIYYYGTEEEWQNINFGRNNPEFTRDANIHFNYNPECKINSVSLSEIDQNGEITLGVFLDGSHNGGEIIAVLQNGNRLRSHDVENAGQTVMLSLRNAVEGNTIRIFWWDGLVTTKPLCEPLTVEIPEV